MGITTNCIGAYPKPEYIQRRLELALQHIDAGRLLAAPDCGLMILGHELALAKLKNMCVAAGAV